MRLIARLLCLGLALIVVRGHALGQATGASDAPRPLRAFLADAGIATEGLASATLDTLVIDFAAERGATTSAIAYRSVEPDARMRLHVRAVAHGAGQWRTASFDTPEATRGSVAHLHLTGTHLLVGIEREQWLGDLLLLDEALALTSRVEGTLVGVLPDGSLLYRENLEEQRPAQPLAVSVFVPATGRHERIYPPAPPDSAARKAFSDRVRRTFGRWGLANCLANRHPCNAEQFDAFIVSDVRADARGHRFAWVTRFGPAEGERAGPVNFRTHVVVSCDRPEGTVGGACRELPFGGFDGPDGPNTQGALATALVRRGERR